MRKKCCSSLVVVAALAIMLFSGPGNTPGEAMTYVSGSMTITCTGQTNDLLLAFDRNNTPTPDEEAYRLIARDGAGTVLYLYEGTIGFGTAFVNDATWSPSPEYNPITYEIISVAGNGLPAQVGFTETGNCPGLPMYEPAFDVLEPGCDVQIPITSSAVVGRFIVNSPAYWAPGKSTDIVIEAGNTAWVVGVDASGAYYKVYWVCQALWIPVGNMGPNYDEVWNGRPLPADVVE